MTGSNPVVDVAKEKREENDIITLADGRRGKIVTVSATLVSEVTRAVKDPPVPTVYDDDRQREIENPHHPDYLRACEEAKTERGIAAMDAMLMFGLELLDGVPEDDSWIKKLQALARHNLVNLSVYDLDDEIDREFLYKRFIAASPEVLSEIAKRTGLTEQAIQEAEESF